MATTFWQRLVGLAFSRRPRAAALFFPRCRSVHTFGMRFAIDLVWLDAAGRVLKLDRGVPPGRIRRCREAAGVIELPSRASRQGGASAAKAP